MRQNGMLIAIDGTAGTGKSSVGKAVAFNLGYSFLSTGELYRALAYKVFEKKVDPNDGAKVLAVAKNLIFSFSRKEDASLELSVDGEVLGNKLHLEEVGSVASKISVHKEAREVLTNKMREIGKDGGIVMEGRDIGTVVFPDAEIKLYLDASAEERAKRRYDQLLAGGQTPDYEKILSLIKERDYRDAHRSVSPLKPAEDAYIIDTSMLNMQQVIAVAMEKIQQYAS